MIREQQPYLYGSRTAELSERIHTKLRQMEQAMQVLKGVPGSKYKQKNAMLRLQDAFNRIRDLVLYLNTNKSYILRAYKEIEKKASSDSSPRANAERIRTWTKQAFTHAKNLHYEVNKERSLNEKQYLNIRSLCVEI